MISIITKEKNSNCRIFYKDARLRSGRNIVFNIWDDNGSIFLSNQSGVQIDNSGVYYCDFVSPNVDSYLLATGTDFQDPQGMVLKIGNPAEKFFYLRGDLQENVNVTYEIYDTLAVVLNSGVMNNIVSWFYSVIVEGIPKPWFVEIE